MSELKLKEWYEHEHEKSVFIMFDKELRIVWSFSGNALRDAHLAEPDKFISEPIELALPNYLYKILEDDLENF